MGDFNSEISRRLREDAIEITQSLEMFMQERNACIRRQSDALEEYRSAIAEIGGDLIDADNGKSEDEGKTDHNLNRHLKLTKKAVLDDDYAEYEKNRLAEDSYFGSRFDPDYVDVPQKEHFDKGLTPKPAVPNLLEKAAIRERVFELLRTSRDDETQMELEYERVREEIGAFRAEYLAEGLFTTQKENYGKLKSMIAEYQPQGFGKAWGNDPDYVQMAEELKNQLVALDVEEAKANETSKKKKKKSKKKGGGH
jgi:hypothetical protein